MGSHKISTSTPCTKFCSPKNLHATTYIKKIQLVLSVSEMCFVIQKTLQQKAKYIYLFLSTFVLKYLCPGVTQDGKEFVLI